MVRAPRIEGDRICSSFIAAPPAGRRSAHRRASASSAPHRLGGRLQARRRSSGRCPAWRLPPPGSCPAGDAGRGPRDGPSTSAADRAPVVAVGDGAVGIDGPWFVGGRQVERSSPNPAAAWPRRSTLGRGVDTTTPRTWQGPATGARSARCRAEPAGSHPRPMQGRPACSRPPDEAGDSRRRQRLEGSLVAPLCPNHECWSMPATPSADGQPDRRRGPNLFRSSQAYVGHQGRMFEQLRGISTCEVTSSERPLRPAVAMGGQSPCRGAIAALHVFWAGWEL